MACANTRRPESRVVRRQQAIKATTGATVEPQTTNKTALQILEKAANNTSLDWNNRINAAKALAPFQSRRMAESQGKKAEKQEAAKQVVTGRFAPSAPPKVVPISSLTKP